MSSPGLSQGPINGKLATPTSNSDKEKHSVQDERFAEDEEVDDAGGLFGSDEEEEEEEEDGGLQYNPVSYFSEIISNAPTEHQSLNQGLKTLMRRN